MLSFTRGQDRPASRDSPEWREIVNQLKGSLSDLARALGPA
jgi:hypothetical protein